MNTRNLFSFVALLALLFGLGLAFATRFMANLYLTNPNWLNPGATLMAQGWGAVLIATGVGCWVIRHDGPSTGSRAMLLLLLVSNVGFLLLHTLAIVNGVEKPLAWLLVVMALVLGGWQAMLLHQQTGAVA